jgi:hypothetical protein
MACAVMQHAGCGSFVSTPRPRRGGWLSICFFLPLVLLLATSPLRAEPVDLALVLAVDVSDSIDGEELMLQRTGYVNAFARSDIINAIKSGKYGRIAVAYFEWADSSEQSLVVDWMVIEDLASAQAFGDKLKPAPVRKGHFTSISAALSFGLSLLRQSPHQAERKVIDISGDGRSNDGPPVLEARAAALAWNVTINGLPIENERSLYASNLAPGQMAQYYKDEVIGGPDAFIVIAKSFADIERAISKKLLREIANREDAGIERRAEAR